MRHTLIIALTFAFALAFGCGKKDEDKTGSSKPAPGETDKPADPVDKPDTPATPDPAKPDPAADPEEEEPVATAVDFEEDVAKEITPENLEKELGAIEKELGE